MTDSEAFERIARELYRFTFPLWLRVLMCPWRERFLRMSIQKAIEIEAAAHVSP